MAASLPGAGSGKPIASCATPMEGIDSLYLETLENLIEDIQDEKCVLMVGPEIVELEGKSLIRYVHEKLLARDNGDIVYYYQSDGLFLFRDEGAKINVARQLKRIFRDLKPPVETYRKILEIPFHLVISLNPDTTLSELGQQYGVHHRFAFLPLNRMVSEEVEEPRRACPLFYNLLGAKDVDESMVLDYEDLYRLLCAALGPDGLPGKLRMELREARSFLFIGFDFEKWYAQLLLQLLTGDRKGRPKFAVHGSAGNSAARNFLINQFRIQFLEGENLFVDQLHQLCRNQGMLRTLKTPLSGEKASLVAEARQAVASNNLKEALEILERLTTGKAWYDDTILLGSRLSAWEDAVRKGTLYAQQADVEINRLREDLLNQLQRLL